MRVAVRVGDEHVYVTTGFAAATVRTTHLRQKARTHFAAARLYL